MFLRYHHWDGYPVSLGKTLFHLYNGHFEKNLSSMLKVLLDDHPAGWSTINDKDFRLEPGWTEFLYSKPAHLYSFDDYQKELEAYKQTDDAHRPICYCHGKRDDEEAHWIAPGDVLPSMEYLYVFDEEIAHMDIYACHNSGKTIVPLADVDLNGPEPNWNRIKEYEEGEIEEEDEHCCTVCGLPAEGEKTCFCVCPQCLCPCFDDVTIADHGVCFDCHQSRKKTESVTE